MPPLSVPAAEGNAVLTLAITYGLPLCRLFICQAKRPYEGYESYYAWLTDQYKRKRCVDGQRLWFGLLEKPFNEGT